MDVLAIQRIKPEVPQTIRYTDADREQTYWIWRTTGGRSYRRTASIANVGRDTIATWSEQDSWVERANREDQEDIGSIRHAVAAVVTHELVPNIQAAIEIRDNKDNSPRDRLAAIQWLSGLAGVAPVSKIEQSVTANVQVAQEAPAIDATDLGNLSPDDLAKRESQYRKR